MAAVEYHIGRRGYPGFSIRSTGSDGSTYGQVIPAMALVDASGNSAGAGTSASPTVSQAQGTAAVATTQVAAPITTSGLLIAARAGRSAVTITNITGAQQVYVGPSGVTATGAQGGQLLPATVGASVTIPTSAAIYGISLTAAQTVSVMETY